MDDPVAPPVSVVSVRAGAGGLVHILVRLPDGRRRTLHVPPDLVTITNVQILAAALTILVTMENQP